MHLRDALTDGCGRVQRHFTESNLRANPKTFLRSLLPNPCTAPPEPSRAQTLAAAQMRSDLAFTSGSHLITKKVLTRDEFWRNTCTRSRAIQIGGANAMLNSGLATVAAIEKVIGFRLAAIVLLLVGSCLLIPRRADAQCTPEPTTIVRGTVYLDASDLSAYAPGAKIVVRDEFTIVSAVADREGKFRISNLDPGIYTVEATYLGLHAEQKISVEDGAEIEVILQLKLPDHGTSPSRRPREGDRGGEW